MHTRYMYLDGAEKVGPNPRVPLVLHPRVASLHVVAEHAEHHLRGGIGQVQIAPENAHQLALPLLLLLEAEQAEQGHAGAVLCLLLLRERA